MNTANKIALVGTLFVAGCTPTLPRTDMKSDYGTVSQALEKRSDGFSIDSSPGARDLLSRQWQLRAEIAALDLNSRALPANPPGAPIEKLLGESAAEVVLLDPNTALVSVRRIDIGTVFILSRKNGSFAPAWSIAESHTKAAHSFPLLQAWTAEKASEDCRSTVGDDDWDTCGPIAGEIRALPDDAEGRHRFFVLGTYAQAAGMTVSAQLTIWRWTGTTAEPLFATTFSYLLDNDPIVTVEGNVLQFLRKDNFKTFFACGACQGRERIWTVRLDEDGAHDAGAMTKVPELDVVDDLLERLIENKGPFDPAEMTIAATLAPLLPEVRSSSVTGRGSSGVLGMLLGSSIYGGEKKKVVCIETDAGGTIVFHLRTEGVKMRVISAESLDSKPCPIGH